MADTYTKIDKDTLAVTTEVEKADLERRLAKRERWLVQLQAQIAKLKAQLDTLK